MIKELILRRLKDVPVKGNFTINCEHYFQYVNVRDFFQTWKSFTTFQKIAKLVPMTPVQYLLKKWEPILFNKNIADPSEALTTAVLLESPKFTPQETPETQETRFIIKYESLHELLKLREVFQIRANKFDCRLIQKRNYNPFDKDFFNKLRDPVIHKVRK